MQKQWSAPPSGWGSLRIPLPCLTFLMLVISPAAAPPGSISQNSVRIATAIKSAQQLHAPSRRGGQGLLGRPAIRMESTRPIGYLNSQSHWYFRYLFVGIRYFSALKLPTSVSVSVFLNVALSVRFFGIPTHHYDRVLVNLEYLIALYLIR